MLKTGVIGLGNMGRHHARNYFELSNFMGAELVAVADIDNKIGKETARQYGCVFYNDYNKMLKHEHLNAVSIAVPTNLHKKVTLDAIAAGIQYILLEKPIADNLVNADKIAEYAAKYNANILVGHLERYNPAVEKLRSILWSPKKELGDIISIKAERIGLPPKEVKDNNVLIDLAVHDIDIVSYLTHREPELMYVSGSAYKGKIKDTVIITLDYDGIQSSIHASWSTPIKRRKLNVATTKGYAELDYLDQSLHVYTPNNLNPGLEFKDYTQFSAKYLATKPRELKIDNEEPLRLEIKDFILITREKRKPVMSLEEAITSLSIALEALERI